jgi:hypothetical protein
MPFTLTELSYYLRKALPFVVLGVIVFFIGVVLFNIAIILPREPKVAPVAPLPEPKFGVLKRLKTNNMQEIPPSVDFVLDTITGVPEEATRSAKVYFKPRRPANLNFRLRVPGIAERFGFDLQNSTNKFSTNSVTYVDQKRRLTVENGTFNYTFTREFVAEDGVPDTDLDVPQSDWQVEQRARNFFSLFDRYPNSIAKGTARVQYLRYDFSLQEAQIVKEIKDANMFKVDIFPPETEDKIPVITQSYFTSPNVIVYIPKKNKPELVKAQAQVYEYDPDEFSLYYLKSAGTAYAQLQNGQGWLLSGKVNAGDTVKIKRMFLAYIDPDEYFEYLMPFFVFAGENDVVAVVPAVVEPYYPLPTGYATPTPLPEPK